MLALMAFRASKVFRAIRASKVAESRAFKEIREIKAR